MHQRDKASNSPNGGQFEAIARSIAALGEFEAHLQSVPSYAELRAAE